VLQNTSKVDKSILNEAKVLAKTFEESVLKMDSGCKYFIFYIFIITFANLSS